MTRRLTDDEIRALRKRMADYAEARLSEVRVEEPLLASMLDEIEERRRIDARRLADAEQAFREECEAEEQKREDFIAQRNDPELDAYEERASQFWHMDLRGRMKRTEGMPMPEIPGKDGGA